MPLINQYFPDNSRNPWSRRLPKAKDQFSVSELFRHIKISALDKLLRKSSWQIKSILVFGGTGLLLTIKNKSYYENFGGS